MATRRDRLDFSAHLKDDTPEGIMSVERNLDRMSERATGEINRIGSSIGDVTGGFAGMAGAAAAAGAGAGVAMGIVTTAVNAVQQAVQLAVEGFTKLKGQIIATGQAARELLILSDSVGLSTEAMSLWIAMGERFGLTADDIGMAIREVNARIGEVAVDVVAGGTGGEAGDAITQLGLDLEQLLELNPEQQLGLVVDALRNVSSGSLRNALANAVLSDQYAELLPLLERTQDAYNDIAGTAEASALVISRSQAEGATDTLAAWKGMEQSWRKSWDQMLLDNSRKLTGFIEGIQESSPYQFVLKLIDQFSDVFGSFLTLSNTVMDRIGETGAANTLMWAFQKLQDATILGAIIPSGKKGPLDFLQDELALTNTAATQLKDALGVTFPLITEIIETFTRDSKSELGDAETAMESLSKKADLEFNTEGSVWSGAWTAGEGLVKTFAENVVLQMGNVQGGIAGAINLVAGLMIGDWDQIWVGLAQITQNGGNMILDGMEMILDGVTSLLAGAFATFDTSVRALKEWKVDYYWPDIEWGGVWDKPQISFQKESWYPFGRPTIPILGSGIGAAEAAAAVVGGETIFGQISRRLLRQRDERTVGRLDFADDIAAQYEQAKRDAFFGTNESGLNEDNTDIVTRVRAAAYAAATGAYENIPEWVLNDLPGGGDAIWNTGDTVDIPRVERLQVPRGEDDTTTDGGSVSYVTNININNPGAVNTKRAFEDWVRQIANTGIDDGTIYIPGISG